MNFCKFKEIEIGKKFIYNETTFRKVSDTQAINLNTSLTEFFKNNQAVEAIA